MLRFLKMLFCCITLWLMLFAHAAEPVLISVEGFSCLQGRYAPQLPRTLPQLRAMGKLLSDEAGDIQQWEGYRTVERKLRFDGLMIVAVTFSNDDKRYALATLDVSDARWHIHPVLKPGLAALPLLKSLDPKANMRNGVVRLGGEADSALLHVQDGKIVRVAYECYTG